MVVGGLFIVIFMVLTLTPQSAACSPVEQVFTASLLISGMESASFRHIRYDVTLRDDQALLRFISALRKVLFLQGRFLWGMSPVLRQRTTFMEAKGCSSR